MAEGRPRVRSWEEMRTWQLDLLRRASGDDVETWNARIREQGFTDEASLRAWLTERGITGYAQMLQVHETFGYPDFLRAGADELIDGQDADDPRCARSSMPCRPRHRAWATWTSRPRKTFVTLVSPRRQFALIRATTRTRVDLGLRIPGREPTGRLEPAKHIGNDTINVKVPLTSPAEVDDEVVS